MYNPSFYLPRYPGWCTSFSEKRDDEDSLLNATFVLVNLDAATRVDVMMARIKREEEAAKAKAGEG